MENKSRQGTGRKPLETGAGEAAIGLAIILSLYRLKNSVNLDDAAEMKG